MEKLQMCRVCLAGNVRMYVVANKNLHDLYEKLTDNPFVTEDSRPMLACFFCCAKLKQCYQFQQKCLEAEELFTQMMNEDYEPKPLLKQDHPEYCNGFIQSPIEHISIVDEFQTESVAVKEELPVVFERLDVIIEPKEEHQSDELELENSLSTVEDVATQSDSEDIKPLMEFKVEVEEHEVPRNIRTASDTQRAPAAKKPKLHSRTTKLEDVSTEEQKEYEQSDTSVIQNPQSFTFTTVTEFEEPLPYTTPRVTYSSNSNNEDRKCKISSQVIDSDDINKQPRLCVQEKPSKFEERQRCFTGNGSLTRQILHTGEKPYTCEVCQRCFMRKDQIASHIRTHTGEKPYKCNVCQHFFTKKSSLTIHTRTHTGEKPYTCEVCQRRFTRKDQITSHIRTHTGEKPYKCNVCQHFFNKKSSLTIHIRTHTGEKPYKCEVCQRSFTGKHHLTSHTRIHTGEKPFKCDVCQHCFSEKSSLINHIRKHTGEKPYKCDVCQRSFNNKCSFTGHTRIHTGEKPFKCAVCQRCFSDKSNLTSHIRTHTREKPYKCDICQRCFSQKSSLTHHNRAHAGKKAFKCDISTLERHIVLTPIVFNDR